MKKNTLTFKAFFAMLLTLLIFSCKKNDDNGGTLPPPIEESKPTIVQLAKKVNILSSLVKALEVADTDLVEVLSKEGKNTVFAPTNGAFNELFSQLDGFDSLDDFDEPAEKEILAKILKYHIIAGKSIFSSNLSNGQVLKTLQTEDLTVNVDISVYVKGKTEELAELVGADNEASNGVVHIIDKVFLPQEVLDILYPKPSIVEIVKETDTLSLFEEALQLTGLRNTLSADGLFTVFAPTNTAIEELFNLFGNDSYSSLSDFDNLVEIQILKQILSYHLIEGSMSTTDLTPGTIQTLFEGESIEIITSGNSFVIGDASKVNANLLMADKEASNGYVHVVDKILIPQQVQEYLNKLEATKESTIKELVVETEEFSLLKQALELTGLLDALGEDGLFTVFAPSNEALVGVFSLLGGTVNSIDDIDTTIEIDLLRDVLLYHVINGEIGSSDLPIGTINTLSGDNTLEVVKEKGKLALVDATTLLANIKVTDISAKNGVIHIVDRVLIPQSIINDATNIGMASLRGYINGLNECDEAYNLFVKVGDRLGDFLDREFTFFLPTNKAFLTWFNSLDGYDSIADFNTEEELEFLVTMLRYHCVETGKLKASDLTSGQVLPTAQGEALELTVAQSVYIADKTDKQAKITVPNKEILKGVIHIVDKVLLPQEIIDALK